MKKGILFSVVALVLVFGGCTKKGGDVKVSSDSLKLEPNVKQRIEVIVSNTTITPPAADNSTPLTLRMTPDPQTHHFFSALVYAKNLARNVIRFFWSNAVQNPTNTDTDGWTIYTIQPADGSDPVNVTVTIQNGGNDFNSVARAPNVATNAFTGFYSGNNTVFGIIAAGDANIFKLQ